jgi:hypothetical protein
MKKLSTTATPAIEKLQTHPLTIGLDVILNEERTRPPDPA